MSSLNQSPSSGHIRLSSNDEIFRITLARTHRHNSLVPEFIDELRAAVRTAAARENLRALVITADGPNFSTGGDVAGFATHNGSELLGYARTTVSGLNALMLELIDLDIPVITAVQGKVTGGSLGIVLASDIVLLDSHASFAPYYVEVGFSPDGGWTALLPHRIGFARAMSVQLLNSEISAMQAIEWGLATEIAPGDVNAHAIEHAHQIAKKQPASVRRTKRLLWGERDAIERRLEAELDHFVAEITSDAARAGMNSFLAGHTPASVPHAHTSPRIHTPQLRDEEQK